MMSQIKSKVKAEIRLKIIRPLSLLRDGLWTSYGVPRLARYGWKPAKCTPLLPGYLKASFCFDEEAEIRAALESIGSPAMSSFERIATLWQQVRYLDENAIEGSLVECGVWKGASVALMALAHQKAHPKPKRHLHLFDSFEGLPEPKSEVDGVDAIFYSSQRASGQLQAIGKCVGTLDENKALLQGRLKYPSNLIEYHVGWFEKTMPKEAPLAAPIALLRLDGDWYESTKVCLEHLYPHVVKGGVIVIDDYGHWEGCRRAVDEFIATLKEPVLLNHIDYSGRFWVKI